MAFTDKLNTLTVVTTELTERADELETMVDVLNNNLPEQFMDPGPPNELDASKHAVLSLAYSAANLRMRMQTAIREWTNLAQSLRLVATAYETIDEKAEEALSKVMENENGGVA